MALFIREATLEFGLPGTTGRTLSDLAINFEVQMDRTTEPNTAVIEVVNPAPESVGLLQEEGVVVRLRAGYVHSVPLLLFQGTIKRDGLSQQLQGTDRLVRIEAADGGAAYQNARVSVSFATETTLSQVLDVVNEQLGYTLGEVNLDTDVVLPRGVVLYGYARDVLDRLAAMSSGAEWFVRDGNLTLITPDGDTGESAVVFDAADGSLVGSPTVRDDGVEVRGLLRPELRPGRPFRVVSRFVNGDYVADRVVFKGSTRGSDFFVTCTGRPRRS